MNKKWLIVLMATTVLATTACNSNQPATTAQPQMEAKQVGVQTVTSGKASRVSELSGTLAPREEATVSFEVAGRITQLSVNEGDHVKVGEILARIDTSDYSLQLARANSTVTQTGAALDKTINGARQEEIIQSKSILDKATVSYQKALDDFKRMEKLYQEKAISLNDYENAKNRLTIAEKDLLSTKQSYALTVEGARSEDRQAQRSSYDQAVIGKEMAALTLSKTQLKSPIEGTVIAKQSSIGQLTSVGAPVYRIGNIDSLKIVLPVPDREITSWKEGDSVSLSLYDSSREGKVTKLFPSTNQSTGTIGVEVTIANPKHDWFAGQVVKATRKLESKEGIFLPIEAVISRGEAKPYVFVASQNKVIKTPVTIGELIGNQLEITSGLQVGQQVVVKGVDRLFDGDPIEATGGK
ncbi:efflux RND transporter periplasmic adaptor subunit [Brevibacillus ginsengisoli]|uniref:efflux RND transporter periplasmic adaptor subunit n=1 Tax=Brevibacillus ginsengisoli TaxID=363854 RepID=UPI003CEC25AB